MGITIRKMRPTDVDNVLAVEALSFHSEAWTRADFEYLSDEPEVTLRCSPSKSRTIFK